jgi:hypothetical protein
VIPTRVRVLAGVRPQAQSPALQKLPPMSAHSVTRPARHDQHSSLESSSDTCRLRTPAPPHVSSRERKSSVFRGSLLPQCSDTGSRGSRRGTRAKAHRSDRNHAGRSSHGDHHRARRPDPPRPCPRHWRRQPGPTDRKTTAAAGQGKRGFRSPGCHAGLLPGLACCAATAAAAVACVRGFGAVNPVAWAVLLAVVNYKML